MSPKTRCEFRFDVKGNEYIKIEFSSQIEIHEEYVESDSDGIVSPIIREKAEDWKVTRTVEVNAKPNSAVFIYFESDETIRDIQYDVNEHGFIQWVGQGTRFKKGSLET